MQWTSSEPLLGSHDAEMYVCIIIVHSFASNSHCTLKIYCILKLQIYLSVSQHEGDRCVGVLVRSPTSGYFQLSTDFGQVFGGRVGPVLAAFSLLVGTSIAQERKNDMQGPSLRTFPFSFKLVTMMITELFCSHTIRQKSFTVEGRGPWVAMKALKSPL